MKKVILVSCISATLLLANSAPSEELTSQITDVKAKLEILGNELKTLESRLPKKEPTFATHTELGYIQTKGNTNTETFNLDAKAKKQWDANSIALSLDGQYAKDKKVTTKNRYTSELNYGYDMTEKFTLGYLAGFKKDKFSGYNYQAYTGPEAKYKLLNSDIQKLSAEVAVLYAQDKIENPAPIEDETEKYGSYRLKAVYELEFIENMKFYQDASYRGSMKDSDIYFITTKTALTGKINSTFSAGLSYKVDYANIAPDDKVRTDKTLTLNLIIDY
ncbi:MAG: DUF481 domain-containing protein [Sulfurimonadaceae bacterium]|jgi:putative salt-induced outer membrane protein|nr:DUF481 domain-containing protein [Sulfurimonadaceae bacterium]